MEAYEYVLRKYNIDVTEILDLKFKSYKVKMASRLSDTEIVKNFQNFPKEYEIICNNLNSTGKSNQINLITGKERINGLKNSPNVQRVFNDLFEAVRVGIDFNLFIGENYSVKKFKALEKISSNYKEDTNHIFSNLIRGLAYSKDSSFNFKELGFFELNKNDANTIKTLFNMIYNRGNFRGAKVLKSYKKGVDMGLVKYINSIKT